MPNNPDKSYLFVQKEGRFLEYDPLSMLDSFHGSYLIMLRPQAKGKFMVAAQSNGVDWPLIDLVRGVGGYAPLRIPLIGEPNKHGSLAVYGGNFEYNNGVWSSSQSLNFGLTRHDEVKFNEFISKLPLEERIKY